MVTPGVRLRTEELSEVGADTTDPLLRALEVAIHVEETLDIVLPDVLLDGTSLGTPQAAVLTVTSLSEDH